MTTEQKIREEFEKWKADPETKNSYMKYEAYKAGYLALLNSLEPSGIVLSYDELYYLPEGVTK